ncbi:ABC transporter substrate-binding protein [Streptosporangium fragile]|uniref:ABC transporter substrate-binding protein n=1 Tax=Streptosporangium fragile TaxID=46186 RepID=A0ABN3W0K6_9ACTN
MRPRMSVLLLACAGTFAAATGCGGSGPDDVGARKGSGPVVSGGTFHYAIAGDPGDLDPARTVTDNAYRIFAFAYDSLLDSSPDGEVVSNLATSWEITPTVAKFTLRKDVTCSDGSPVTATTIAQNLNALKDPKMQSPRLPITMSTGDYTVAADDARATVTVRFKAPVSFLSYTIQALPIVCGEGLRDRSLLARGTSGTGPYVLKEAVSGDHYTLTRRKDYRWGPDGATNDEPGQPETVVIKVVPNPTTIANLLLAGELSGARVNSADAKRLEQRGLAEQKHASGLTQMLFNQAKGRPAADPAVRRALTMAVDRGQLAKIVSGPDGRVGQSVVPEASTPCPVSGVNAAIPAFDAAAAAAVLDDAGWAKGADGVREKDGTRLQLNVISNSDFGPTFVSATELVAKAWRELGADVKIAGGNAQVTIQALASGNWDVVPLLGISVAVPSQFVPLVSGPVPPQGINYGAIDNPDYLALVGKAVTTADQQAACKDWNAAEAALFEAADVVPMVALYERWWAAKTATFETTAFDIIPTSIRMRQG